MQKIVIISNTFSSIMLFRKHFVKFLLKSEYVVFCFAIDYNDASRRCIKEWGAIPVDYELSRGGLNPFSDLYHTYKLSKKIKEIAPDIVLSTFSKPVIYGTIAARLAGIRKIAGMLEGLGYFFTEQPGNTPLKTRLIKRIQIILYKTALPRTDVIIFLNKDDRKDLIVKYNIKVKRCEVLGPIGLNLYDYPFSNPVIYPISFIFIGRLLKEKGIFEYLEAAKIVKARYPSVVFYVLGGLDRENPGGLKAHTLKSFIDKDIIVYPGLVSEIQEWIAKSSVFVLPSYYREGYPRSTQEAMAMGRAVITTDVPGCRDTVKNGENGFLISKWSVQELVDKMLYFIEHPDDISRMGIKSYQIAKQSYDGDVANEKLLGFIESSS